MQADFGVVQKVHKAEISSIMMTEIRFDAIVKMNDVGFRKNQSQWFAIQEKITLESIMYESEAVLGRRLKEMFQKLQTEIEKYKHQ